MGEPKRMGARTMMTDTQAQRGKSKPCPNGCGKNIYFESRFNGEGTLIMKKKDPSNVQWYMMEDASKQAHDCPKSTFKKKMDKVAVEHTQDLIMKDQLHTADISYNDVGRAPKPRIMDVADFAETPLRARVKLECKFIRIIEDEVTYFLGKDASPAKIGMYTKIIKEAMQNE